MTLRTCSQKKYLFTDNIYVIYIDIDFVYYRLEINRVRAHHFIRVRVWGVNEKIDIFISQKQQNRINYCCHTAIRLCGSRQNHVCCFSFKMFKIHISELFSGIKYRDPCNRIAVHMFYTLFAIGLQYCDPLHRIAVEKEK